MDTEPEPLYDAIRLVGASGMVCGVAVIVLDGAPSPFTLTASSLMLYDCPFVKPEITTGLDVTSGLHAVYDEPLSIEYL